MSKILWFVRNHTDSAVTLAGAVFCFANITIQNYFKHRRFHLKLDELNENIKSGITCGDKKLEGCDKQLESRDRKLAKLHGDMRDIEILAAFNANSLEN